MKKMLPLLCLAFAVLFSSCNKEKFICKITYPYDGTTALANSDLTVTVEATDTKNTIVKISLTFDELFPIMEATAEPFTFLIPADKLIPGRHTIKAVAVNSKGERAEATATVYAAKNLNLPDESPDFVTFTNEQFPAGWSTYTWEIDNTVGFDDKYSLRAANRPALVFAQKTMEVPGYIEFYSKGEHIDLFIDNVLAQDNSSIQVGDWTKSTYFFEKGKHLFKWQAGEANTHIDAITFAASVLPVITTDYITYIHATTAISGGNIIHNGNSLIICRGVCWSTSQNPTTHDYKTENGTGTGSFKSYLGNLSPNTTYYLRAYAINWVGTSYGEQKSFKTLSE